MKVLRSWISACLALSILCGVTIPANAAVGSVNPTSLRSDVRSESVIDVTDFGADPTGKQDSTEAIWKAFEAAKKASNNGETRVTVNFPTGEYHIYKDTAQK